MTRIPPASIVIDRPIGEVFAFVTDPRNDPRWHTTVLGVQMVTDGPLGAGSRFIGEYDSHRRTLAMPPRTGSAQPIEAVLLEHDAPRASRLRVRFVHPPRGVGGRILGPVFDLTFAFSVTAEGTRVERSGDIHPTLLVRPLLPLFGRLNAKRSDDLLKLLKEAVESEPTRA